MHQLKAENDALKKETDRLKFILKDETQWLSTLNDSARNSISSNETEDNLKHTRNMAEVSVLNQLKFALTSSQYDLALY